MVDPPVVRVLTLATYFRTAALSFAIMYEDAVQVASVGGIFSLNYIHFENGIL